MKTRESKMGFIQKNLGDKKKREIKVKQTKLLSMTCIYGLMLP